MPRMGRLLPGGFHNLSERTLAIQQSGDLLGVNYFTPIRASKLGLAKICSTLGKGWLADLATFTNAYAMKINSTLSCEATAPAVAIWMGASSLADADCNQEPME